MKKHNLLGTVVMICAAAVIMPSAFAADANKPAKPQAEAKTAAKPATAEATAAVKPARPDFSVLNGKTGTLSYSIFSEEKVTALMNQVMGTKIKNFVFCNTMVDGLAMLKSGRADFMMTSDMTADYIIQRNPGMKYIVFGSDNSLVMILRKDADKLKGEFDAAIGKLKASGKLAEVYKKWITDLPAGKEPAVTAIEKTNYPETVYVGVTGDIPPFDYITADGKPAGYNVALLAEIAKLIGKNIELVTVAPQAKQVALQSKKIDVFFWQRMPSKKGMAMISKDPDEIEFHKKFLFTEPYVNVKTVLLMNK